MANKKNAWIFVFVIIAIALFVFFQKKQEPTGIDLIFYDKEGNPMRLSEMPTFAIVDGVCCFTEMSIEVKGSSTESTEQINLRNRLSGDGYTPISMKALDGPVVKGTCDSSYLRLNSTYPTSELSLGPGGTGNWNVATSPRIQLSDCTNGATSDATREIEVFIQGKLAGGSYPCNSLMSCGNITDGQNGFKRAALQFKIREENAQFTVSIQKNLFSLIQNSRSLG